MVAVLAVAAAAAAVVVNLFLLLLMLLVVTEAADRAVFGFGFSADTWCTKILPLLPVNDDRDDIDDDIDDSVQKIKTNDRMQRNGVSMTKTQKRKKETI